ncbi:MAG: hypothetical protein KGZ82_10790 [Bacteroidales bacterium]|nr:hypothetical protein [Bacteroidales bacterium]
MSRPDDKIFSPIKERVLQYVDYKSIYREKFYLQTGISPSNFKGSAAKSELGGDKIVKILTTYPDLSPIWLTLGQGNMIINDKVYMPVVNDTEEVYKAKIPPGPCQQCDLRERLLDAKEETINSLRAQIKMVLK